jgi:hypothetical protein
MTVSSRSDGGPPAILGVPFDELPADLRVRAFGVDYGHLRLPEGGDLYLTRYGWPNLAQLLPANWYADRWFAQSGQRLPGSTGHAYHVLTRPAGGKRADLVVKFSRVAQDVPLTIATSFPDTVPPEVLANARFNSPWEELGLVMELRRGGFGPQGLRVLTQHPLGIYAPPEEYALWQLGRSEGSFLQHDRLLAEDQENAVRAIELDIRRIYVVLYQWIKGMDAEASFDAGDLGAEDFHRFTPRVIGELQRCGFRVLDNKPKHFILRKSRRDGQILRGRDGHIAYALVDFELLQRTPEHHRQFKVRQRRRYWDLLRHRDEPPAVLPSHLKLTKIFGVSYVMGTGPDGGKLWIVGHDPELWDYFSPDRWLRTPRLKLSPMNEVYRTRTRDNIHVVYRRSRVGTRPRVDPLLQRDRRIREYGFNSPFEEIAIAELLRQMGVSTTHPRAIYRTDHPTTTAEYLRDDRRFADHADLLTPEPVREPILSRNHDYYTVWDCFRGVDPHLRAGRPEGRGGTDLERARDDGLLGAEECAELIEDTRRRLRRLGLADAALADHECVVTIGEGGALCRDQEGGVEVTLGIDALTAYDYGLLTEDTYRRIATRLDERLRAVDCEALDLAGNHLLLSMDPDGRFKVNESGEFEVTLCNFELIRGLYRPLRY